MAILTRKIDNKITANCPKCYRWHELFSYKPSDASKRKLLVFCNSRVKKIPFKVTVPYEPINGIEEYIDKTEHVFLKDPFRIIKKSEYENQKLF